MLRGEDGAKSALSAAGFLHALGIPVDFGKLNGATHGNDVPADTEGTLPEPRILVDLPAYSWDHSTTFKGFSRFAEQHEQHRDSLTAILGAR